MNTPHIVAISLGWGVQSWTLAAMSALGDLPKVDFAIHSDTTWERSYTYKFAKQWTPWLEKHGVKVVTVSDPQQAKKATTVKTDIPAYSIYKGKNKMLRRQCTGRWKITPMRRYIASELKRKNIKKTPGVVEQWLGITTDEWHRAKDSDVKYVKHAFPLIDKRMSRSDCLYWLKNNDLPSPSKSACNFCPYTKEKDWKEMKRYYDEDWEQAVMVDESIRNVLYPEGTLYVFWRFKPLKDIHIPEDYGAKQLDMFDVPDDECDSGYCFL